MSRAKTIAHQWLTTDEAMGAVEVPIPRQVTAALRGSTAVTKAAGSGRAAAAPAMQFRQFIPRPVPVRPAHAPPAVEQSTIAAPSKAASAAPGPEAALPPVPAGSIGDEPQLTRAEKIQRLAALAAEADKDLASHLSDVATRVVFGEGDPGARLMFIGEGPGLEEDRTGRPFVGRAGQLLDKMIVAMGFTREKVYIGNICKLRAASWDDLAKRLKDRPPTTAEAALGLPWLHQQIAIIQPRVIVTLGLPAIRYLVGVTENMGALRGHWHEYRGIAVMPTYHPAYLLRAYSPENRGKVWSDLQAVVRRLKEMDKDGSGAAG
ncbi:MAG: uracil-DNA glycosylase [Phycisphaerae bacterium]|nr:uracil-DNA glycosylase [Phycisphaerae bacterium]